MNPTCLAENWIAVCRLDDIPKQGSRVVRLAGREPIAVFRAADDCVFAMIDQCPHKGGPLSAGLVHGHAVTCPLHGWIISLEDGRAHDPDEGCAAAIGVRTESDRVYLNLAMEG